MKELLYIGYATFNQLEAFIARIFKDGSKTVIVCHDGSNWFYVPGEYIYEYNHYGCHTIVAS